MLLMYWYAEQNCIQMYEFVWYSVWFWIEIEYLMIITNDDDVFISKVVEIMCNIYIRVCCVVYVWMCVCVSTKSSMFIDCIDKQQTRYSWISPVFRLTSCLNEIWIAVLLPIFSISYNAPFRLLILLLLLLYLLWSDKKKHGKIQSIFSFFFGGDFLFLFCLCWSPDTMIPVCIPSNELLPLQY